VTNEELPAYFQAADLLLYAPLLAGFGLPPLEAMASGAPVVTSDRGSIPDVVQRAAICVDAEAPHLMADAMARVLTDDSTRRRLVADGLARAAAFQWSDAIDALLTLYRRVAAGN
jgi:glycosyltransferase involved in cell wall biosynthesis